MPSFLRTFAAAAASCGPGLNTNAMKKLITRSLSGIVYVALIVGALLAGSGWFSILMALFSAIAVLEFQKLVLPPAEGSAVRVAIRAVDALTAAALPCAMLAVDSTSSLGASLTVIKAFVLLLFAAYPLARFTLALYDRSPRPFAMAARSVMSIVYIVLPLTVAAAINGISESLSRLSLMMFVMIWLNDTGAFCVGSLAGRHKMYERLSPKKTWEGFAGGVFFCVGAGVVAALCGMAPLSMGGWIGMGAVVAVFSTWGDLFESLLKRNLGVKDSGHLIPGHGGILDRIDSLLFVSPALLLYLAIVLL